MPGNKRSLQNFHGFQQQRFLSRSSYTAIECWLWPCSMLSTLWDPGWQQLHVRDCWSVGREKKDGSTAWWFFTFLLGSGNWYVPLSVPPHISLAKTKHVARLTLGRLGSVTPHGEGQWLFRAIQFTTCCDECSIFPAPPICMILPPDKFLEVELLLG